MLKKTYKSLLASCSIIFISFSVPINAWATQTSVFIEGSTNYEVVFSDPSFRGTDWSNVQNPGNTISAGESKQVALIGDPRANFTETDHWGWLYFKLKPTTGLPTRAQIFVNNVGDNASALMGFYDPNSNKNAPMPAGTFGECRIDKKPPAGKIFCTIP